MKTRLLLPRCSLAILAIFSGLALNADAASPFKIYDSVEFAKIINTNVAVLTTNTTINTWLEGPVWIPSGGGYLLFCDQSNNKLKKLVPPNTVSDFIDPPANTLYNGTTLDLHERLVAAQAGSAGIQIVMVTNGVVTTVVSSCNGLKFYSPNDVVVKSDETVWFTDPAYNGVTYPAAGYASGLYVYRCNLTNGNASCVAVITNGIVRPNGLCFSPDESKLYVADSDTSRHRILVYNVSSSNTLSGGSVFATVTNGIPDGIRCDVDGRIWSSGGDGAYIFATDGHLIGKIQFVKIANLCFGGPRYHTLFMTGQPVVVSVPVLVAGEPSLKHLQAGSDGTGLNLSWPAPSTGFALQENDGDTNGWYDSDATMVVTNDQNVVTVGLTNAGSLFRLTMQ